MRTFDRRHRLLVELCEDMVSSFQSPNGFTIIYVYVRLADFLNVLKTYNVMTIDYYHKYMTDGWISLRFLVLNTESYIASAELRSISAILLALIIMIIVIISLDSDN